MPLSKRYNLSHSDVPVMFYNVDIKRVVHEGDSMYPYSKCVGKSYFYKINLNQICKTDTVEGYRVIKRVKFTAINTNSINVNFLNLKLGNRSVIYTYGTKNNSKINSMDESRNYEERNGSLPIFTDTLILELNEPINNIDSNYIFIEHVSFRYIVGSIYNQRNIQQDICLKDINCSVDNIDKMILANLEYYNIAPNIIEPNFQKNILLFGN